jgi:hypothetical protein
MIEHEYISTSQKEYVEILTVFSTSVAHFGHWHIFLSFAVFRSFMLSSLSIKRASSKDIIIVRIKK